MPQPVRVDVRHPLFATWILTIAASLVAGDEVPYAAFVCEDEVWVRSGPSDEFYQTHELSWGTRVDVYRHDGEFAAIRPPEGSFSWLPAEVIDVGSDQTIATVNVTGAKTRIGSDVVARWDAEYITLEKGERVEVLGFQTVSHGEDTPKEWVKVAPPSGEFRWVRLTHLQKSPPVREFSEAELQEEVEPVPDALPRGELADAPQPIDVESADELVVAADPDRVTASAAHGDVSEDGEAGPANDSESTLAQWSYELSPKQPLPPRTDRESVVAPVAGKLAVASELVPMEAPTQSAVTSVMGPLPPAASRTGFSEVTSRPGAVTPEYLQNQLAQLEVAVSREVCKPTAEWELGPVHTRCSAVIDAAASAEIRQRAHALLAKIVQFEDVRRRELRLASSPVASPRVGPTVAAAISPARGLPIEPQSLYDGSGWLMPVLTNRSDVPRYVLTDDDGRVLQFVSPQPGLNLSRYERKKIGVFGRRGYLPSVSQPHLMAERIVSLDKVR